ncbi:hypothetical protein GCM10010260_38240 [Streptomyces filipinensis]|uniref:Uncharacterized protein n=1 Tax=Streptomyces filipinensis TaxID=66887 RepID=A0A918IDQ5_9ACTN|nr:hypothetical protein GCM10010260_38240 [Streptomyces filipinensis]
MHDVLPTVTGRISPIEASAGARPEPGTGPFGADVGAGEPRAGLSRFPGSERGRGAGRARAAASRGRVAGPILRPPRAAMNPCHGVLNGMDGQEIENVTTAEKRPPRAHRKF